MKLLYTNFHAGEGGGHTTYVMALARAFATRHEVHVAAPEGSRLLDEARRLPGVHAIAQDFPNALRGRSAARRSFATLLRAHRFDVVHVNGSADHRLAMAALRGIRPRPRIVLTKHNTKPMTGIGHAWRARFGTDAVIAVCDFTLRDLERSAYRRCHLATVHNGIDTRHFAPWPAADAAEARRAWPVPDDALLLGSNAGTGDHKGWMDLVDAIALLEPDLRRQVHVLLAGKPLSDMQQQRIAGLGLQAQVHAAGLLADVRPAIAAIDVGFVLSYATETISFACREMMAMGKPVLLTDYAGLPENITPEREGWLVPVRDPPAIAERLRCMLAHRDSLPAMCAAARARAEAEFGLERFAERTDAVYRAVLGRG